MPGRAPVHRAQYRGKGDTRAVLRGGSVYASRRHGRTCSGHPRLATGGAAAIAASIAPALDAPNRVRTNASHSPGDGRDKPGHDGRAKFEAPLRVGRIMTVRRLRTSAALALALALCP